MNSVRKAWARTAPPGGRPAQRATTGPRPLPPARDRRVPLVPTSRRCGRWRTRRPLGRTAHPHCAGRAPSRSTRSRRTPTTRASSTAGSRSAALRGGSAAGWVRCVGAPRGACGALPSCAQPLPFLLRHRTRRLRPVAARRHTVTRRRFPLHRHTPSHTVIHRHTPSHTVTHRHTPSRTVTHRHAPLHLVTHRHAQLHPATHRCIILPSRRCPPPLHAVTPRHAPLHAFSKVSSAVPTGGAAASPGAAAVAKAPKSAFSVGTKLRRHSAAHLPPAAVAELHKAQHSAAPTTTAHLAKGAGGA